MAYFILTILIIYILTGTLATAVFFKKTFSSCKIQKYSAVWPYEHYRGKYPRREVSFPSGKETLRGYVYGCDNDKGLIVFSHGIWSGPDEYLGIITAMVDRGFVVFAYDYTGYNNSTGRSSRGLCQSPIDLDAALKFIEKDEALKGFPIITMGHSWGAYASTAILSSGHRIAGAVAMSGFNSPQKISMEVSRMTLGPAGVLLAPFTRLFNLILFGKKSFLTAVDGLNASGVPALISHGNKDNYIHYETASISCMKDKITNPNVRYDVVTDEYRNNHDRIMLTSDAAKLMKETIEAWSKVKKSYKAKKEKVPEEVRKEFFEGIDKEAMNQPPTEYYDMIADFCGEVFSKLH